MTLNGEQLAALESVRAAMLRRATRQAEAIRAAAHSEAEKTLVAARRDAEAALAQAPADGVALAAPVASAERSRGRRAAHAVLLATEHAVRDEAEGRIRAAVLGLRDQPGYGELRDRLAVLARAAAGPGSAVSEDPAGGVIARGPGVLVDCTLPRLAERIIAALGPQIREVCRS